MDGIEGRQEAIVQLQRIANDHREGVVRLLDDVEADYVESGIVITLRRSAGAAIQIEQQWSTHMKRSLRPAEAVVFAGCCEILPSGGGIEMTIPAIMFETLGAEINVWT